jgi:hypothetical protein
MTTPQTFGSALQRPWVLVVFGSDQPNGRRPSTSVAYLTDDEGTCYLGGLVEFYRSREETTARWHYRYKHAKRIPKDEVLHIFPVTDKSKWGGPTLKEVRRARKAIPKTELVP